MNDVTPQAHGAQAITASGHVLAFEFALRPQTPSATRVRQLLDTQTAPQRLR